MAEIYKGIGGQPFDRWLANTDFTQQALDRFIRPRLDVARAILASHHVEGHAHVYVERGRIDRYLVLEDSTRGVFGSMSIEFGRELRGDMKGLFILHTAMNAPVKEKTKGGRRR